MSCLCCWLRVHIHSYQVSRFCLFALSLSLFTLLPAFADPLDEASMFEKDGIYHIYITAEIAADEEHIRRVLTDYVHVYRLSDSIIESRVLESPDDGKQQVLTRVLCCIPLFCREVTRVDEVNILDSGDLQAVIIPEQSDFSSGTSKWQITSMGDCTRLTYIATIEPDFFIPPILGTQIVINNMRDEFKKTFSRIEHIARINEAREWEDDFIFVNVDRITVEEPCNDELMTSLQ